MPRDLEAERHGLSYIKMVLEYHEEKGDLPSQEIQAIRYGLATLATEINGDDCRFPTCSCPRMNCSDKAGAS